MRNNRRKQVMTLSVLVVGVLVLSIGFAVFSSVLNISSTATYTPGSDVFKIKFSKSSNSIIDGSSNPVSPVSGSGGSATITNNATPTISKLQANFTSPGQSVVYEFYAVNQTPYDAYLTTINYLNITGKTTTKECTGSNGATPSLVSKACEGISVKVEVGTTTANKTTTVNNHTLGKNSSEKVKVTIEYTGQAIDGSMTVTFGDISLIYSTAQGSEIIDTIQIYRNSAESVSIGADIDTFAYETNLSNISQSAYLKHDVVDNKVTASYACITYEEDGVRKDVCLRGGDSSYYASNQEILQSVESYFNTLDSETGYCDFVDSYSGCDSESLSLHADFNGEVGSHSEGNVHGDDDSSACVVNSYGNSNCTG